MNKKGDTIKIVIIIVVALIALGVITGYFASNSSSKTPLLETVRVEPVSLTPNTITPEKATITFQINNPTLIDYSGKTEFVYDEDCLSTSQKYKDVFAKSQSKSAFQQIITIKSIDWNNNLPEKCYQTQSIFLRLEDNNSSRTYDTKEVTILITHP